MSCSNLSDCRSLLAPCVPDLTTFLCTHSLEQTCYDHSQYCVHRSINDENVVSGHALMATAPPAHFVRQHGMDVMYGHRMPDLPKPDLARMLALSSEFVAVPEEVTPVMAWKVLITHPRAAELTAEDIALVRDTLIKGIRCYGFGAVLESFEVRDVIMELFDAKGPSQIPVRSPPKDWPFGWWWN